MSKALITEQYLSDIADSIRNKLGVNTAYTPAQMASAIDSIGGGTPTPTPVESNDVNFYDYDGTLLYSYSKSDFAQLTAMPANPSHSGLTAQGWNWSLSDAKTFVAANGILDIGQSYVTSDGKTRVYVVIRTLEDPSVSIRLGCSKKGDVTIDWNDGNTSVTTSTSLTTYSHTYTAIGEYIIKITATTGNIIFGNTSASHTLFSAAAAKNKITKIELGTNIQIKKYAFYQGYSLQAITFPTSITYTNTDMLCAYCYSLKALVLPSTITVLDTGICRACQRLQYISLPKLTSLNGEYHFSGTGMVRITPTIIGAGSMFYQCYSLKFLTIPALLSNTLGGATLSNCYCLDTITIPASCTNILTSAFSSCTTVRAIHFLSTTPPALADTQVFSSINSNCIFYVPQGYLQAYLDDTNWATFSAKLQEEPS